MSAVTELAIDVGTSAACQVLWINVAAISTRGLPRPSTGNRASTLRRDSAEAQSAHFGKSSAYTSSRLSDIIGAFANSYGIPCTMAGDEN
jgi:hypothetical protein